MRNVTATRLLRTKGRVASPPLYRWTQKVSVGVETGLWQWYLTTDHREVSTFIGLVLMSKGYELWNKVTRDLVRSFESSWKTHMPKTGIPNFRGNNLNCQTAQSLHLMGFIFVGVILPKTSKINKWTHDMANMSRFDVDWPFAFVCTKAVTLPSPFPTLWRAIGGHSPNILVSLLVS